MHTLKVWKIYRDAPEMRRAEKSAAGSLPMSAYQYCEALRAASSLGWYVYPPTDLTLTFDGREAFYHEAGQWYPIKSEILGQKYISDWNAIAPKNLADMAPPYLSSLFMPGVIQVWSGYFIQTKDDWFSHVRPIANFDNRSAISVYDGIVDTDRFKPWPLFINLRLVSTNVEIHLSKDVPLFQLQAIPRECLANQEMMIFDATNKEGMDQFDWNGVGMTLRDSSQYRRPGSYAAEFRKRK